MKFDEVIAPLKRETFLSEHWSQAFLRMPGKAGRFTDLLTWKDLNAILEQHRLEPPRLRLVQDGAPLDPGLYMRLGIGGQQRIDSGRLAACLAGGATLIVEVVEEMAPRVRDLSDSFREVLHAGNYVNLYAGWHSQNGFDLHWDSQDTVILQLAGKKRWKLYKPTRLHPLEHDAEAPVAPTGEPEWDGLLEDGDALYIPRGWWHMAYPVNEPSLHLTVATVPPNGMDLVQWMAARLRRHPELRADLPFLDDPAGQAALMQRMRALVMEEMTDGLVADFRRQWEGDSFPRARVRLPEAPYVQFAPIGKNSTIRLAAAHRLAFTPAGDNVEFWVNGMRCLLLGGLTPALELLSDVRPVPFRELAAQVAGDDLVQHLKTSLETLARAGVVQVEDV
jgi:hypothetical protein